MTAILLTAAQQKALDELPLPDESYKDAGDDLRVPPDVAARLAVIREGWSEAQENMRRAPAYRPRVAELIPIWPTQVHALGMNPEPLETWAKVNRSRPARKGR